MTCRLTDAPDREWLVAKLRDVVRDRLGAKLDDLFRHLAPSSHAVLGPDEMRGIFFGGYMDAQAETAGGRSYDEAVVRSIVCGILYDGFWLVCELSALCALHWAAVDARGCAAPLRQCRHRPGGLHAEHALHTR